MREQFVSRWSRYCGAGRALDAILRLQERGIKVNLTNKSTLDVIEHDTTRKVDPAPFVLVAEGIGGLWQQMSYQGLDPQGFTEAIEALVHQGAGVRNLHANGLGLVMGGVRRGADIHHPL